MRGSLSRRVRFGNGNGEGAWIRGRRSAGLRSVDPSAEALGLLSGRKPVRRFGYGFGIRTTACGWNSIAPIFATDFRSRSSAVQRSAKRGSAYCISNG